MEEDKASYFSELEEGEFRKEEDKASNLRQPTVHRKHSEKNRRSYSQSFHISSKERQYERQRNCFGHGEYEHVQEKIEKVCSERLNKLLLQQNGDRKEFNILQKKQELEFFREHVHSYKVRYECVIPTVRYERIRLPKLLFCTLRGILDKHIQHQLIKFMQRQIRDRNKEKRIKERWIFEAKAGYLKKYFAKTPLTYSEFEMVKPKWDVHDYSEGEQQLKYLDMRSLSSAIEAIASSNELADSRTGNNIDASESILENLQSPVKTNGGTKYVLSVAAADGNTTIDSMPSLSNCSPVVDFGEKVGTQVTISSPPQNEGESVRRSCSSVETLEIAEEITANSGNTFPVSREKRKRMSTGGDASEGSCSRSHRKLQHEFVTNFHEILCHKEPQAARLSSVDVNQREQPDNAGREDVSSDRTSGLAQVTEQQNTNANYHQQTDRNTCSVRTGLDSPRASNLQQESINQSVPITPELSRLLKLHDLMTKRHLCEKQKLILEREMEEVEIKKKYDELFHNLEMETLQKKTDLQILHAEAISCSQRGARQILAEAFQHVEPSAEAMSCSQRGAPSRTIDVANQSSGQHIVQFPTTASMNQPSHPAVQSSTHEFLRQPQEGATNTSGISAATLTRCYGH